MKKAGFTLIELLVVIVIIGILSTISTATFKAYFKNARDGERQATIQNIAMMVKVDSAQKTDENKFDYTQTGLIGEASDTTYDLKDLFLKNDFVPPKAKSGKCYYFGFKKVTTEGNENNGEENEFVVFVAGENVDGFVDGTVQGTLDHKPDTIKDFTCTNVPTVAGYTYLKIDNEGEVVAKDAS